MFKFGENHIGTTLPLAAKFKKIYVKLKKCLMQLLLVIF